VTGALTANAEAHALTVLAARARLVVFPELSLTGYDLAAPAVAADDPVLAAIVDACGTMNTLALVGAPIEVPADDGAVGGRAIAILLVDAHGSVRDLRAERSRARRDLRAAGRDRPDPARLRPTGSRYTP
jgi:predicted amidohydrolase